MRSVSIAMPYWNRPRELRRSMEAYARVYPDLDIEFSICDDGSEQAPEILLLSNQTSALVETLPRKTRALNPCVPLNIAIRQCTRDVIVLTNPEIEHREPVLYDMLEALQGPNDYVMTGCRNVGNDAIYAGPGTPYGKEGREPIPPGTDLHFCVMFHRELFDRAGGFDERYRAVQGCDDNDWLWKLWSLGDVNFKYVPGIVWHHSTRHAWTGTPAQAAAILKRKWGHLPEFNRCVS